MTRQPFSATNTPADLPVRLVETGSAQDVTPEADCRPRYCRSNTGQ